MTALPNCARTSGEVWFLDASAFVKLLIVEAESAELRRWIRGRDLVSSDLLRTEARRAVAGEPDEVRWHCERLLEEIPMIRLVPAVLDRAGELPGRRLRSLDAIYLASALRLGDDLSGIVSYDMRQLAAAKGLGIPTCSPGAS